MYSVQIRIYIWPLTNSPLNIIILHWLLSSSQVYAILHFGQVFFPIGLLSFNSIRMGAVIILPAFIYLLILLRNFSWRRCLLFWIHSAGTSLLSMSIYVHIHPHIIHSTVTFMSPAKIVRLYLTICIYLFVFNNCIIQFEFFLFLDNFVLHNLHLFSMNNIVCCTE